MRNSAACCEVAVLGGGPAGATAAACLARAGVSAVLVDEAVSKIGVGEGLPPGAQPLLRHLGVWDAIGRDGHAAACANESAWGSTALNSTHFVADPNGTGWHLDRPRFDALLQAEAREAGADVRAATGARLVVRGRGAWEATIDTGTRRTTLSARWLIDCSGRRASGARRAGAVRSSTDRLIALVARCPTRPHLPADPDAVTLVESGPDGWWYTSRLPSGERVVGYLTDADDASARRARTTAGFAAMLGETTHVGARVARFHQPGKPRIVSAATSRLDRAAGEFWLAAGDAAMALDPLSSQGILNAMYSGMAAARAVVAHLGGDGSAVDDYRHRLDGIFTTYLKNRHQYYRQERRWPDRPFWRRRTTP